MAAVKKTPKAMENTINKELLYYMIVLTSVFWEKTGVIPIYMPAAGM